MSTPSPSLGGIEFTRRSFCVSSLATGFALAVQPVFAAAITTDSEGLQVGAITIPVSDGEIPGYRAMPARGGPFPLILVVQEIFGIHAYIQDVCRRLAKLGYLAIAPELYARQGEVSQLQTIDEIRAIVAKVPDTQVMADLDATVAWGRAQSQADAEPLGMTGFCWGGRITWLYAAHNPDVKAAVAWYGRLVGDATPLTPKHPIDIAKDLQVPVLGLYGGKDDGIPLDTVEQMRSALKAAGSPSEIVVYPEAPHGFHADYRPSYRPEIAAQAWQAMQSWFKKFDL
jgi:carboxymethylenebutenolidase